MDPTRSNEEMAQLQLRLGPRPKAAEICGESRSEEKKMVMGDANRWELKIFG
jgi:hypothetical protein